MNKLLRLFSIQPSSTNATIASQPAASVSEVSEAHMRPPSATHLDCDSGVFTDMKLLPLFFIQPSSSHWGWEYSGISQPATSTSVSEVSLLSAIACLCTMQFALGRLYEADQRTSLCSSVWEEPGNTCCCFVMSFR